jgi:hypothetical protein
MQQAGCDVIVYQLRGHMLARSKRFIFADRAGLFHKNNKKFKVTKHFHILFGE